jgi:diguanylate cyclase (GGDEF)-like protein
MNAIDPVHSECSLLNSVMSTLKIGAVVLNASQQIILWNRWMEKHSGISSATVINQNLFDLFPELLNSRIFSAVQQALRNNFPSLLSQTLNKAPFPLHTTVADAAAQIRLQQAVAIIPLKITGLPRHCLIQINDVSAAVMREKLLLEQALELRSQSFSDGLTGIANRRHFDVNMEKEVRRAKRTSSELSFALIDIDYFKAYNDHYGHQQGDECLIKVASTLASAIRRPGDLVARYGGEEFGVILPDTSAENAFLMMEAIRKQIIELHLEHRKSTVGPNVTVSIGVTTRTPHDAYEVCDLINQADRALYQAKGNGRNNVVSFDPENKL